jgi:hypothetical protein
MPRIDRTFSHKDVIRIFCNHLTPAEQRRVLAEFQYGEPCEEKIADPCADVPIMFVLDAAEDVIDKYLELMDLGHDILISIPTTILRYLRAMTTILKKIPIFGRQLQRYIDNILEGVLKDIFIPLERELRESAIKDAVFFLDKIAEARTFIKAICEKWQ